ncbi:ATP-binding protein [Streptomyces sp. AK02-01A]|uniref:ATP-binding protein n=1 Tax=Streptomyces sp. AK02-01A TaxID=3028648 RepID=UPI0029BBD36C|nr:ATP-binding protein [Streptomyces sp. AK02-01A]MDX3850433.1 ATP-binding protein [Streptomyces sp. AK02-01A]
MISTAGVSMAHEDETRAVAATGTGQGTPPGSGHSDRRIDIAGDASGPVVAGNHNVVIDADHGSTVTLLVGGERPQPVRRAQVALLPRRQAAPLGRDAELRRLATAVREGGPVQVWGAPGVGKSALLRHTARTLAPGADGVVFLDAAQREPEDLAQDIFEACYEARGYAPSSPELRRLMGDIKVTVYVDNAEFSAEGLRHLMDAAPDATFVVAGRERTLLGEGSALRLEGIDRHAALELLARELGRPVAAEPESDTAATLWETAVGRPLLLLRAAALARLDPSGRAVLPRPGDVADLLPLLFDRLEGGPLRALHLLATLQDAELDPAHVGALTDASDPSALCARLAGLGLAEQTETGYRVVPDVAPALRERELEPFPVDRLSDHFAEWIARPSTTAVQVAQHARALEQVAELAEQAGRPELAVRIVRAASPALARSLRFGVWGRLLERGLPAAQRAGDQQAVAYFTHERGIRNLLTGRRVMAGVLLAEAAYLWQQLGDLHGANAAAGAQQYVPPTTTGTPVTGPHTDGAAQSLNTGGGPDPASAHAGTAHDAGSAVDPGTAADQAGTPVDPGTSAHQAGVSVDPGTAAHQAAAPVDPSTAAHQAAAPVDPSTAAHQAGLHQAGTPGAAGAHGTAGATAAGASTAGASAAGASAASVALMKVIAVIVAVVIGGIAIHQAQTSRDSSGTSPLAGPTGLAGVWRGSDGNMYEFKDSGTGSYTQTGADVCGNTSTVELTGSNGTYTTIGSLYDSDGGSCGAVIGEVTTTVTLSASGDSAQLTSEMTSSSDQYEQVQCYSCGTITLTRER